MVNYFTTYSTTSARDILQAVTVLLIYNIETFLFQKVYNDTYPAA